MSVYVDEPVEYAEEPKGYVGRTRARARWCHMIADTSDELHAIAQRIGLRREWFQADRWVGHYDLVPTKRALAVRYGAVALGRREFVEQLRKLRQATAVSG